MLKVTDLVDKFRVRLKGYDIRTADMVESCFQEQMETAC